MINDYSLIICLCPSEIRNEEDDTEYIEYTTLLVRITPREEITEGEEADADEEVGSPWRKEMFIYSARDE